MLERADWHNPHPIPVIRYRCWSCGDAVASEKGLSASYAGHDHGARIAICPGCTHPTFLTKAGDQFPSPRAGNNVAGIDDQSVLSLYNEARDCTAANANTAAVLCCRKILMHVAVSKGAPEGQTFVAYVDHLAQEGYVPPDGKDWVDHIRKIGNQANHEIMIATKDVAEELLSFMEMLLKFVYEFPFRVRAKAASPDQE